MSHEEEQYFTLASIVENYATNVGKQRVLFSTRCPSITIFNLRDWSSKHMPLIL